MQHANCVYDFFHLAKVNRAIGTIDEVCLESVPRSFIERAFKVVRHKVNEFLARQIIALGTLAARHFAVHRRYLSDMVPEPTEVWSVPGEE
ncbi:MAG: hypothetical protein WKF81_06285 [Thermomicrobiales bacterium]